MDIRVKVDITCMGGDKWNYYQRNSTKCYFSCHCLDKLARGPNETQTHTHAKFSIDKTSMTRKSRTAFAFTCEIEISRVYFFAISREKGFQQLESGEKNERYPNFPINFPSIPFRHATHRRSLIFFSLSDPFRKLPTLSPVREFKGHFHP